MEHLLVACSCGLDPATETMAVQAGLAAVLSAPLVFREQIANALRRLRRKQPPGPGTGADAPEDDSPIG